MVKSLLRLHPDLTPIPTFRPNLISHLAGTINSSIEARYANASPNASLILRRSLEVLNAILKEYAAFKMLTGVKTMGQVRGLTSSVHRLTSPIVACRRLEDPATELLRSTGIVSPYHQPHHAQSSTNGGGPPAISFDVQVSSQARFLVIPSLHLLQGLSRVRTLGEPCSHHRIIELTACIIGPGVLPELRCTTAIVIRVPHQPIIVPRNNS